MNENRQSIDRSFKHWLEHQSHLSVKSKYDYYRAYIELDTSSPNGLHRSLAELRKRYQDSTFDRCISVLREFSEYLKKTNPENPLIEEINRIKRQKRIVVKHNEPFTLTEIDTLLRSVSGWRHQVIWLVLNSGLLKHELVNLKMSDISIENKTIQVRNYGRIDRSRKVFLTDTVPLEEWGLRRELMDIDSDYWIITHLGKPLRQNQFFPNELSSNVGFKVTWGRCRITYTKALFQHEGINMYIVMKQLGISDLSNTYRYLKPHFEHQMEEISKLEAIYPFLEK